MDNDSVTTAFELLIEEIDNALEQVQEQSVQYVRAGDIDKAESQLHTIRAMKDFQNKLVDLRNEWQGGLNIGVKQPFKVENISVPARRGPRTALVVKLANGKIIKESTAAETFARVIKEIGIEKVERLRKTMYNWPLVSKGKHPNSIYTQQKVDNIFIMTHNTTLEKKKLLEDIARELNFNLDISITL